MQFLGLIILTLAIFTSINFVLSVIIHMNNLDTYRKEIIVSSTSVALSWATYITFF
jgi:hypothetical protein